MITINFELTVNQAQNCCQRSDGCSCIAEIKVRLDWWIKQAMVPDYCAGLPVVREVQGNGKLLQGSNPVLYIVAPQQIVQGGRPPGEGREQERAV